MLLALIALAVLFLAIAVPAFLVGAVFAGIWAAAMDIEPEKED